MTKLVSGTAIERTPIRLRLPSKKYRQVGKDLDRLVDEESMTRALTMPEGLLMFDKSFRKLIKALHEGKGQEWYAIWKPCAEHAKLHGLEPSFTPYFDQYDKHKLRYRFVDSGTGRLIDDATLDVEAEAFHFRTQEGLLRQVSEKLSTGEMSSDDGFDHVDIIKQTRFSKS